MSADLTPAQAARLEGMREAAARWLAVRYIGDDGEWWENTGREDRKDEFRHQADELLAAIDVMRGATDDGAVGRVLALADEFGDLAALARLRAFRARSAEMPGQAGIEQAKSDAYEHAAHLLRAAVGAPATAEGDDRG